MCVLQIRKRARFNRLAFVLLYRSLSHISSLNPDSMETRMNTKFAFAILASAMLCASSANAQNLFRPSRPDYTRQQPAFQPNRSVPWQPAPSRAYAGYDARPNFVARPNYVARPDLQTAGDYRRLESAWENYRREAFRYQQRYGNDRFTDANTYPVANQRRPREQPRYWDDITRVERPYRDGGVGRGCRAGRTPDRVGSDFRSPGYDPAYDGSTTLDYRRSPADYAPSLRPTIRGASGLNSGWAPVAPRTFSTSASQQDRYAPPVRLDPVRTASSGNPFSDLLAAFLPAK